MSTTGATWELGAGRRSLALLCLVAAALRLPLAFWPNVYAPDEIFQYLEPAWRLLGHESIVSWEWRYGIRGWLLPTLFAAPVALGDWLAPGGTGAFVVPRLISALLSLSIVATAWLFGARLSRMHAIMAGLVAAIWFEFVFFAPHTLSEPLATAAIFPAAWLLTERAPSWRQLIVAGLLLGVGLVFRFQYAPAIAILALSACGRQWWRLTWVTLGGALALAAAGVVDALQGAVPFGWLVANIHQNWMQNRAADFGVHAATDYIGNFLALWSLAALPLGFAVWRGWRHAPCLLWAALANLLFHSAISHKEHRFVFLSAVLLVTLAALGSADWIRQLRERRSWRPYALPLVAGGWILGSGLLAATGHLPEFWTRGTGASELANELRSDPKFCGVATYEVPFVVLVGQERLAGRMPVYALTKLDPAAPDGAAAVARKTQAGFNRIVARREMAADLPSDFAQTHCAAVAGEPICIFARMGSCDAAAAARYAINDVLIRIDR